MHRLLDLLCSLPSPVSVIPHDVADIDAVASAFGIKRALEALGKDARVVARSLSAEASYLLERLGLEVDEEINCASMVVVDASDPSMVSIELPAEILVVDHHPTNSWKTRKYVEDRCSCSEIVYELLKELDALDRSVATLLLLGVYTDTAGLMAADSRSLNAVYELLEYLGGRLGDYTELILRRRDISERIAMLKALRRAEIYRVGDVLVVLTNVSAFEASAAMAALKLGADVAVVYSEKRVTARATMSFIREYFSLLDIFREISKEFGGVSFGGHEGAAGAHVENPERFARALVARILERLVGEPRRY